MTAECRPPSGTPDGTVCVVHFAGVVTVNATWRDSGWDWPYRSPEGRSRYTATELGRVGWEIAEPPDADPR